jgi:hypothetical protein
MAVQLTREQIEAQAQIHTNPPAASGQPPMNRTFELPSSLYITTVALYLGFMAVMMVGFGNPVLILPVAVIVFTIIVGFGLPRLWTGLAPDSGQQAKSYGRLAHDGIQTGSGKTAAGDASVQVLILPVLIFLWGIVTVIIAALV